jgi:hypothetical protein
MASEDALPAEPEFERLFADIAPGLHDWVLQDIIEWVRYIYERTQEFFNYYWTQFTAFLSNVRNWILEQATNAIHNWWYGIQSIFFSIRDTVYNIWNRVATIATEVYHNVSQALEGMVYRITSYIGPFFSQLGTQLGSWFTQAWTWISTSATNLGQTMWAWIQETWTKIETWFSDLWTKIADWFSKLWQNITEWFQNLGPQLAELGDKIGKISGQVLSGLDTWAKGAWDNVTSWLEKDAHEGLAALEKDSPWPTEEHGSPFMESFWRAGGSAFSLGSRNFMNNFSTVTPEALAHSPGWMENIHLWFESIFTKPLHAISDIFESIGHTSPRPATDIIPKIAIAGVVLFGGLAAFTIGGELVSWFKHLGLGHVSAMLYDMVNYKVLTGSLVTALSLVYISTPVKYFYQEKARPYFPDLRELCDIAKDYGLSTGPRSGYDPIPFSQVQGMWEDGKIAFLATAKYHGLDDEWLETIYEDAFTPPRYFPLKAMADAGLYDEEFYTSQLMKSGYTPPMIKNMLDMLQKMSLGEIKGVMLPLALTRFREGFSDIEDFKTELHALGLPKTKIGLWVFAAQLSYQTDYASDMLAAYRTQFRKDMITEADFRQLLKGLSINPVKIEGYVLRENASKFKPPKVTKAPKVVPEYLTDEGQLRVNTAKEAFRRDLSSAAELEAELVKLEMPPDLAEAFVEFELIRKTPPPTG